MNWILGTAQFGLGYGINGRSQPIDDDALGSLLRCAWENGIQTLDTAPAYGDSESRLGRVKAHPFRIMSKLAPFPFDLTIESTERFVIRCVEKTLKRLDCARLAGLLVHREGDLLGPYGAALASALNVVERLGLVDATGVSVYRAETIDALLERPQVGWQPKIIQVPSNPFDRRLIKGGQIARLRQAGVRIIGRSIFLQGLLLMAPTQVPKPLEAYVPHLDLWQRDATCRFGSPHRAALAYAYSSSELDAAVIGVDDEAQLRELIDVRPAVWKVEDADRWAVDDARLVDPSTWRLGK